MICVLILMKSKNIMHHISTVDFPLESKATKPITLSLCCVVFSSKAVFDYLGLHGLQHARPPCPSLSSKVCPSSYPLHQWCHPAISSSDALFCSQSFPASRTFPMSWLFTSGDQNTGASASASVFSMSIQGWFPLRFTGLISLLSKGLSEVFSSTIVRRHQFFSALPSSWSSSHNRMWTPRRPQPWLYRSLSAE